MKIFLGSFLIFSILYAPAKNDREDRVEYTLTCYQKYTEAFERRGAKAVADGVYDDVIITFRKGSMADCFYGKATVKDGAIKTNEMYLRFEDGTYEKIMKRYRHPDQIITIDNGMSRTMVTQDEELINVLFVKMIKPKKKAYSKAAEPNFDF